MTEQVKSRIALLGTGLMGRPMAEKLLAAGYPVTAYNRTREKAQPLVEHGAVVVDHPHQAIEAGECVLVMLADEPAIRETLLERRSRSSLSGRSVIQMGTIGPAQSQALQAEVFANGGDYLEAPVLGSIAEIRAGELIVMVGGEPEQYDRWREMLTTFDPNPRHVGNVGKAAALKLALNHLIGSLTISFSLSLAIVIEQEVPVDIFMGILRASALYAPTFDKKLPRMLERGYRAPTFPGRLLLKDLKLVEAEARALGLETGALDGVRQIMERAIEMGFGDDDYSAVYDVVHPDS